MPKQHSSKAHNDRMTLIREARKKSFNAFKQSRTEYVNPFKLPKAYKSKLVPFVPPSIKPILNASNEEANTDKA